MTLSETVSLSSNLVAHQLAQPLPLIPYQTCHLSLTETPYGSATSQERRHCPVPQLTLRHLPLHRQRLPLVLASRSETPSPSSFIEDGGRSAFQLEQFAD